ncbi:hypothetical protein H5410_039023 [Solanum commersonii]|uniref:Retrovirus-related Pol polyprotein from transposon TNT 1-94-like beta-barrel domain-containing protein n=1 Tax=Solanum commersonii TaxID=4109 RepID=A0A9J5YD43_SOLCO|nr:hypothetical protein H5410_039023 [Solanum commersonii]
MKGHTREGCNKLKYCTHCKCEGTSLCNVADSNCLDWIVDSGASDHMVGTTSLLNHGLTVSNPGKVQLATGDSATVTQSGNSKLTGEADTWPTENVQTPQPAVVEDGAAVMPDIAIEHTIPAAEENVMNQSTEKEQRRSTRSVKLALWRERFL